MTQKPLMTKLRLQPGMNAAVVNPPDGYLESLALPAGMTISASPDETSDFVQLFVRDSKELARFIGPVLGIVGPNCVLWFCYPKQSSGIRSDLTRDEGWQALYAAGWRGVASIAIDDIWSGVRFRPGKLDDNDEAAFAAQYAGGKAALRPIYDRVLEIVSGFGDDVDRQVRKTYVAFARGKQFAVVQPSTKTRVDVGLKLPGVPAGGRLEETSTTGGGAITHKVSVTMVEEVDAELAAWLRAAYDGLA
jgi:hypothetical protein